jgi:predicted membrane channel-forming protein YqfA (hemolysin III family)
MPLSMLHVSHSLLHSLQHLSLHNLDLLKCWRWVGSIVVIVLICGTIVSVCHLMNVKRFETEIEIEIKDSQLYASRYNND